MRAVVFLLAVVAGCGTLVDVDSDSPLLTPTPSDDASAPDANTASGDGSGSGSDDDDDATDASSIDANISDAKVADAAVDAGKDASKDASDASNPKDSGSVDANDGGCTIRDVIVPVAADTYFDGTCNGITSYGSDLVMVVGDAGGNGRALLRFTLDSPQLDGAEIRVVALRVHPSIGDPLVPGTLRAFVARSGWEEGLTQSGSLRGVDSCRRQTGLGWGTPDKPPSAATPITRGVDYANEFASEFVADATNPIDFKIPFDSLFAKDPRSAKRVSFLVDAPDGAKVPILTRDFPNGAGGAELLLRICR